MSSSDVYIEPEFLEASRQCQFSNSLSFKKRVCQVFLYEINWAKHTGTNTAHDHTLATLVSENTPLHFLWLDFLCISAVHIILGVLIMQGSAVCLLAWRQETHKALRVLDQETLRTFVNIANCYEKFANLEAGGHKPTSASQTRPWSLCINSCIWLLWDHYHRRAGSSGLPDETRALV